VTEPVRHPGPARKRLDAFEAVFQVAQLTVRRSLKGWRPLIALAVVALPAAIGALVAAGRTDAQAHEHFFYGMLSRYHFGIAVPVVALVFATAFPWPEAEEGTLTYWFTSPIPRWTVSLGRYLAALLVGTIILTIGVFGIGLPLHARPEADLGQVTRVAAAATLMAYPAYLALFQLVSTAFRKGLAFGVMFIFVENFVALLTGPIVQLTLIHYVRSQLSRGIPPDSLRAAARLLSVAEPASNAAAISAFAGVTAVALGLSLILVEWIEYRGRTSQPG
jgi:ABC-type transport system involved in multi-copper enzyme maturation permease subunit